MKAMFMVWAWHESDHGRKGKRHVQLVVVGFLWVFCNYSDLRFRQVRVEYVSDANTWEWELCISLARAGRR